MKAAIFNSVLFISFVIMFQIAICSGVCADEDVKSYLPDGYELDDTPADATEFRLCTISPQTHNFHKQGDEDWIKFHAFKSDEAIVIKTFDFGDNCETVITLFDRDGMTQIGEETKFPNSVGVNVKSWRPTDDGIYYVRITHRHSSKFGAGTIYNLWIYRPMMPNPGYIEGLVVNAESGNPIGGAVVQTAATSGVSSFISYGYYTIQCPVGDFTVTATKTGYETFSTVVTVGEASRVELHIALTPSYAYNSSYELIQWVKWDSDTYYCIDICDLAGNAYQGLENIVCGDDMNAWSPKDFININLGIPDSALSGFRFMWKIRSSSGYGGQGFEGSVVVP